MAKLCVLILLLSGGYYLLKDNIIFTDGQTFIDRIGTFIALEGSDEYVIATLKTGETYQEIHCIKTLFGQCLLPTRVEVHPEVFYKYFIKLSELRYSLSDDTLTLRAPQLYLSTPVAMDASSIDHHCQSVMASLNCKETFNTLMDSVSERLKTKGILQKSSIYEKAARSLADTVDHIIRRHEQTIVYKNIAVIFGDEHGETVHWFRYNASYCGARSCTAELSFRQDKRLIIE